MVIEVDDAPGEHVRDEIRALAVGALGVPARQGERR